VIPRATQNQHSGQIDPGAAGTVPNTIVGRELPGFHLDGKYFQAHDEAGQPVRRSGALNRTVRTSSRTCERRRAVTFLAICTRRLPVTW